MTKVCSKCSQSAHFSIAIVLSTVGISKRLQQCSPVVLFCKDCLRARYEQDSSDALSQAVNSVYTRLNQRVCERHI